MGPKRNTVINEKRSVDLSTFVQRQEGAYVSDWDF